MNTPLNTVLRDRTIRVEVDRRFSSYDHKQILKALGHLSTLNLRFIEVNNYPNLSIKFWANPQINSRTIGFHRFNENAIYIDSYRTFTDDQLRALVLHETGHWLGMRHICLDATGPNYSTKYDCSNVGYGTGIMNPILLSRHVQDFTELDIREFREHSRF